MNGGVGYRVEKPSSNPFTRMIPRASLTWTPGRPSRRSAVATTFRACASYVCGGATARMNTRFRVRGLAPTVGVGVGWGFSAMGSAPIYQRRWI
jgi:hypothetical protein